MTDHTTEYDRNLTPVPYEAFDPGHPDHEWWVEGTGKCLATDCPTHVNPPGGGSDD